TSSATSARTSSRWAASGCSSRTGCGRNWPGRLVPVPDGWDGFGPRGWVDRERVGTRSSFGILPFRMSKRNLAARVMTLPGLQALVQRLLSWKGVLTLAYHRIGDDPRSPFDRDLWSATPDAFETQVRFLKRNFDVISPADLMVVLRKPPARYVLVTFDDGYR